VLQLSSQFLYPENGGIKFLRNVGTVISKLVAAITHGLNIRSVPFVRYRHRNDILTDLHVFSLREYEEVVFGSSLCKYVCPPWYFLKAWTNLIHIWYLRYLSPLDKNILAAKIRGLHRGPQKAKISISKKTAVTNLIQFQLFLKTSIPHDIW
jgi:hypothetical protein